LSETDIYPDEDTIPAIPAIRDFATRNVEPLAQTWIIYEFP